MESKYRTFKQLQKEKTFEELNYFAKIVTEAYATSDMAYTQTNACRDNFLTHQGLRDLMDYAIITAIVPRNICEQVMQKAIQNQRQKKENTGSKSIIHHRVLMEKREKYLLGEYSHMQIKQISTEIAENPSKQIQYFTEKYNLESDRITKKILEKAIIENIVSDEVMEKIIERSLTKTPITRLNYAKQYFECIKEQRQENKKENP